MIKTRLIKLLSHARKYILLQVFWQWLSLLCQIFMIYSLAMLVEGAFIENLNIMLLGRYGLFIGGALCIRFLCDRLAVRASFSASVDVKRILREKIYDKLLRLGPAYREHTVTSGIVQMAGEGVEQLEIYFGKYLPQLFYSLLAPLTLFAFLFFVSWKAGLVLLICVPLIPASIVFVQKFAKRLLNKYWGIYTELGDSFLENLQGLTTLKIYQADEERAVRMDEESQRFRRITMKVLTMQLNSTSLMDIIAYGGAAAGIIVALREYMAGAVGLSGTLMIILLASEFFIPLRLLGSFFHIAMNGMAASDKIFALLDLPESEEGGQTLASEAVDIRMTDVSFAYTEERPILDGVNLFLPAGSFTSLVGLSGSGKSTIASLLMGRNRGYEGRIEIGGAEVSDIKTESLMSSITLVSHNSYLFKGTVRDNLRMGKPDASRKEMEQALQKVKLFEFLEANQGLETPVMEQGSNFSGGQRQRLALARALLHDTAIYIFDEATSNIDVESEEQIMEVIHELARTKTVLLISHRLANVVESDRIYMLENGQIKEQGNHGELMAAGAAYQALYRYQTDLEAYGNGKAVTG